MSLIEKEYALEKAENQYYLGVISERTKNEIIGFIKNLPSAQPEIIRCKNCEYRGEPTSDGLYRCEINNSFMYCRKENRWMT